MLMSNGYPRIKFNHGPDQEGWCKYKAERLRGLDCRITTRPNAGYGETLWVSDSMCHPTLVEVMAVVGKPKLVTRAWLDSISEEGWAWWYMDDGSLNRGGISFHTEGFSVPESELIRQKLHEMGFASCLQGTPRGHTFIRFGVEYALKWLARFGKYAGPGMAYKYPEGYSDRRRPAAWGPRSSPRL